MTQRVGAIGVGLVTAALSLGSLSAQQETSIFDVAALRDAKARELITAARIAVFGGPGGVALLHGMRLKGKSRFESEDGTLNSGTVEIRILLPDRYLRIDSGDFGRRLTGYAGGATLNLIESANGRVTQDPREAKAILVDNRVELARLMLGLAAYTSPEMPLALSGRETMREMPGPSDPLGIDAAGDNGFAARLILDAKSRAPARVVFWGPNRSVLTTTFSDRQSSGGMKVPHRIVTTAGERVVDELVFDEVAVNPKLTRTDFTR